jgi:drug/metabolite transporter (DMT)-like permease
MSNLKIALLAILATFLWSTAFVGIKIGLQYTEAIQFAGVRFILSGLMIIPIIKNKDQIIPLVKENFGFIFKIAFFQTFLQYAFFYLGIDRLSGALTAIVIGAGPLFIASMAHFMMPNDKMDFKKFLGILIGFGGIVLVAFAKDSSIDDNQAFLLGILFLVLANVNMGYTNIFIAKNKKPIPALILSSASLFIGGIILFLFSFTMENVEFSIKPSEYYLSLFWLSSVSAGAISIWTFLLRSKDIVVSTLNMWKFIVPVFGAILSWILLPDESPQTLSIIGMVLITISLLWVNFLNRKKVK